MYAHFAAWRTSLASQGMTLVQEDFYRYSGTPSSRVIPMLAEAAGVRIEFERALAEKERFFLEEIDKLRTFPPVIEIASQHRGRLPMAVASGGTRRLVRRQLEQAQIIEWFDAIVTCEDTERHKPDPDVFLEAARRLGVSPQACCVYEDGEPGIEAARRAGMQCVDVRPFRQQVAD